MKKSVQKTIIKKLIEKIEGEANLDYTFSDGEIEDVKISFAFYRGIEEILVGKDPKDALVIAPRVCGICNHAHLITAVRAIENGYANAGVPFTLSNKAEQIREFTLHCELAQNHIKWLYLSLLPNLEKYLQIENSENYAIKASYFSSTITKALAIFGGQWPHSSYAVPGGVTCDPTHLDLIQAQILIDTSLRFFEEVMTGISLETYLSIESVSSLDKIEGDFGKILQLLSTAEMADKGQSYDRFIVFADSFLSASGQSVANKVSKVESCYVQEEVQKGSEAKAVSYKQKQYEVGPLARGIVSKRPIVKSLHKQYKDSMMTRVFARIHEVALLLESCKTLLQEMKLDEPSCTLVDPSVKLYEFEGTGIVEAARGSLIHKTTVSDGVISEYEIITPTQWNLSQGTETEKGIAVKAMVGSKSIEEADFIFRTFDVCSVCTTQ